MILVLILNFAESKLLPQGDINIKINGDDEKTIKARPGSTLLSALAGENIFLPSACGGGGTCAMCKCQVSFGGGDLLPTEKGHIGRKEAQDNWRLGCQVKIKEDMEIQVSDEFFNIQKCPAIYSWKSALKESCSEKMPIGNYFYGYAYCSLKLMSYFWWKFEMNKVFDA